MMKDPWNFSESQNGTLHEISKWPSPNDIYSLKYENVKEIIDNYPLTGNCYFQYEEEKVLLHIDAGGPPVWSEDNKFFALTIWLYNEEGYVQRIGLGSIDDMTFKISTDYFNIMQLVGVNEQIIEIVENPTINEKNRRLKINELDFYETIHLFNLVEVLQ